MTAAQSMQEMYRSWALQQQGLHIRSLTPCIILNTEKRMLHLVNETRTAQQPLALGRAHEGLAHTQGSLYSFSTDKVRVLTDSRVVLYIRGDKCHALWWTSALQSQLGNSPGELYAI